MLTPADRVLARRPTVPNSTTLAAWRDNDVAPAHAASVAAVAVLTKRRDAMLISGSSAAIDHAEVQLSAEGREVTRLELMRGAADAELPRLAESERAATERLLAEKDAADAATLALRQRVGKEWDKLAAALVSLATEARKVAALRTAFYRLHQSSPELARAAVPISLVSDAVFAPNQGAGTIEQTIVALPAFSDPDAPSGRPRHWPPPPPAPNAAPRETRAPEAPYVNRGRVVVTEVIPPPSGPCVVPSLRPVAPSPTWQDGPASSALAVNHPDHPWNSSHLPRGD